jgi:hypothetical protein
MIQTSLDWSSVEAELHRKARNLAHGKDVIKLIDNIRVNITALSKAEVAARRGFGGRAQDLKDIINKDIELVEEFLLVAALIG